MHCRQTQTADAAGLDWWELSNDVISVSENLGEGEREGMQLTLGKNTSYLKQKKRADGAVWPLYS